MDIDLSFQLAAIEPLVFRVPIEKPVRTSFGTMVNRPALFLRAVGSDGVEGWGEVWCNFPACGAEHRARLIRETIAPLCLDRAFTSPAECFGSLSRKLEVLAIQSGEPGPLAQAVAGIDMAIWDMVARRAGLPLHVALGGAPTASVPAYASGINPDRPEEMVVDGLAAGHRAFKLKIGFGREIDLRNLRTLRDLLGVMPLMADANQGWSLVEAEAMLPELALFNLGWLEEPLRADAPSDQWATLARRASMPLAAGENVRGEADFAALSGGGDIGVVQPDLGKWGGFSACLPVARQALAAGRRFCPHWLGGGIGLVASAHLLAAAGGDGMVEVDCNPNPLRDAVLPPPSIADGRMHLADAPGLGVIPDMVKLESARVA